MDRSFGNLVSIAVAFAALLLIYILANIFYRLCLSPIRKFPGPKLAAITRLYEGYYDLVKDGEWAFHIQNLHKQYGLPGTILIASWRLTGDRAYYSNYSIRSTYPRPGVLR